MQKGCEQAGSLRVYFKNAGSPSFPGHQSVVAHATMPVPPSLSQCAGYQQPPPAHKTRSSPGALAANDNEESEEDNQDLDGVIRLKYHHQYISGLQWAGSPELFTSSYDGSVRRFDLEAGVAKLVVSSQELDPSALCVTPDAR